MNKDKFTNFVGIVIVVMLLVTAGAAWWRLIQWIL